MAVGGCGLVLAAGLRGGSGYWCVCVFVVLVLVHGVEWLGIVCGHSASTNRKSELGLIYEPHVLEADGQVAFDTAQRAGVLLVATTFKACRLAFAQCLNWQVALSQLRQLSTSKRLHTKCFADVGTEHVATRQQCGEYCWKMILTCLTFEQCPESRLCTSF